MIEIVGAALYQWDTGRYVTTDIEADHIHFSNKGDSKAVIMDVANSQAKVPDYLLQTGKHLCVYVVRNGVTVESRVFSVTLRERPENYIYEEDQRNFVYELIADAQTATEAAKQAAKEATDVSDAIKEAAASGKFNGEKGEKGDPGEQGPKGDPGEKGEKGDPASEDDIKRIASDEVMSFIDDDDEDPERLWSSAKCREYIDTEVAALIDDASIDPDGTWSSEKISEAIREATGKQYELIEEIKINADTDEVKIDKDKDGNPLNLSAIRIKVKTAAASGSAQIIFILSSNVQSSMIYQQVASALSTGGAKATHFVARNDHGMIDCFAVNSDVDSTNYPRYRDGYIIKPWSNVVKIRLITYPTTVLIPKDTEIQVYGIRG